MNIYLCEEILYGSQQTLSRLIALPESSLALTKDGLCPNFASTVSQS